MVYVRQKSVQGLKLNSVRKEGKGVMFLALFISSTAALPKCLASYQPLDEQW